jgi:methylenetetrahydrofolate reductase (NADPH)
MSKVSNDPIAQARTGGARSTPASTRLVVGIGDLHGHYIALERLLDSLQSAYHIFRPHEPDRLRPGVTLVFTGDYIDRGDDALGIIDLIEEMNLDAFQGAAPGAFDAAPQFFVLAAVSPFKYTESSSVQQYYKMEKKISCGAQFFITQVGWDWKKSAELFRYAKEAHLNVPIIGNVYLLSTLTAAPRLMHDIKLTGCFVSDELLAKVYSEKIDDHIERAAQQVAMYKSLGAAGVDVAGVSDFAIFTRILERADQIGDNWQQYKDNLCWPKKDGFYLYDETGKKAALTKYPKKFKHRFFNFFHRTILNSDYHGFYVFRKIMSALGTRKGKGAIYKLFNASEKSFKYMLFDCQECGDCYLPENFGLCTIGGCEKGLDNPPCGDATVEGYCGNNLDLVCIGELIYEAAGSEKGGIEKLRATINKPRNPALEHTASILNYLFRVYSCILERPGDDGF